MRGRYQIKLLAVLLLCLPFFTIPAPAHAVDNLLDVDITVEITADGSAHFTERRTHIGDEHTEFYKNIGRLHEKMKIEDFWVEEGGVRYQEQPEWNIKATRGEKAGKFGKVNYRNGSVDLAWGLGDPGKHTYVLHYTVTNFVLNLKDSQAISWKFINDKLSPSPQGYQLTIKSPRFTPTNVSRIHVFGNHPDVDYVNSQIFVRSEDALYQSSYLVLLGKIPANTFSTATNLDVTFDELEKLNFEKRDVNFQGKPRWYQQFFAFIGEYWLYFVGAAGVLFVGYSLVSNTGNGKMFISKSAHKLRLEPIKDEGTLISKSARKKHVSSRVPELDLPLLWELTEIADDEKFNALVRENFVSFYLMKWTLAKTVFVVPPGLENNLGSDLALRFDPKKISGMTKAEAKVYGYLIDAAGENKILEKSELKKFVKNHKKRWGYIIKDTEKEGRNRTQDRNLSSKISVSGLHEKLRILSSAGAKEYANLVGFKNYLESFTLVDEREISEVGLWKTYLTYATAFGCADRVLEQLRPLVPMGLADIGVDAEKLIYTTDWSSILSGDSSYYSTYDSYSGGSYSYGGSGSSGGGFSGGGSASFGGGSGGGTR
ncbi:hypothetical protein BSR28_05505 [Boudabousia liubingyangii]|uniref:DUF2207 family protein n=1 Tax=Boudabousia liubingyangii TaxID=1921764 RepID=UPI00093B54FF|nr:DUF2207 domain-containing protein [Boudabousia liubingyangii]OKL46882.1 hypothetical protein BSR28_05505 [Boudabousia liubingyangii]